MNEKIGKIKLELLKEEFIKQIKDSYTLNLSMVLLEEFKNLQQENARLKEELKYTVPIVEHNKIVSEKLKENARLKDKIDKAVEYIKTNCKEWENDDYDVTLYYSLNQNECDELLEILKEN